MDDVTHGAFRIGFVTGATPDKWAGVWRQRRARDPLELVPVSEAEQLDGLHDGSQHMALVRMPIDRDGPPALHCIPLYDELPVAVMSTENLLTLADDVSLADLAEEQLVAPHRSGWRPDVDQLAWPPMTDADAVETVAAGTGVVILPMSVARLHNRRDVVHRVVTDLPPTSIGLAWPVPGTPGAPDEEDERVRFFVGVVRGRSARSTRT